MVRASLQTLIVLDVRDQQQLFAQLAAAKGAAVSEIVEPALANWRSDVMQDAWITRVKEQAASPSQMMLAMNGLAAIDATGANDALKSLVQNTSALRKLRLAAAQVLGIVAPEDQLVLASELEKRSSEQFLDALLGLALMAALILTKRLRSYRSLWAMRTAQFKLWHSAIFIVSIINSSCLMSARC